MEQLHSFGEVYALGFLLLPLAALRSFGPAFTAGMNKILTVRRDYHGHLKMLYSVCQPAAATLG